MPPDLSLTLQNPDETAYFARTLAPLLGPGDVLLLEGEIGAGKSHFARALIDRRLRDLGLAEDIPSPTFTLVQTYHAGDLEIWHSDLYRLNTADEAIELGLQDAFDSALCLVEWPDRLGSDQPLEAARLSFTPGAHETVRELSIRAPEGSLRQQIQQAAARWETVPS
ncbi:MAG: tRNA (adenosine(37)-N6)-threonylcarbamoyltransferase complex ATPase subunit type 1 TsaE [Pseudomonadota bacterium]